MKFPVPHLEANLELLRRNYGGDIVAGRQLFPFEVFEDGVIICQMCCSRNITNFFEPKPININPQLEQLVCAKLIKEELAVSFLQWLKFSDTMISFCRDCGFWFGSHWEGVSDSDPDDQHIIQIAGCIGKFSTPTNLPAEALAKHLRLNQTRIGDITPRQFEVLVGEFLKCEWQDAEITHVGRQGGPGDGGVDFVLIMNNRRYLAQVKHRTSNDKSEGVQFIRELNGAILREAASGGIFVTSARRYTAGAKREVRQTRKSQDLYDFYLLDRLDLKRWLAVSESVQDPWTPYLGEQNRDESTMKYLIKKKHPNITPLPNLDPDEKYEGNIDVYR